MIRKPRLFTPGPAPVHGDARGAAVGTLIHHRTRAFRDRFAEVQDGLGKAFRTRGPVAVLAASGTGAMEAAAVNRFAPGDRVGIIAAGKFSARWGEIARAYGMLVEALEIEPGRSASPSDVASFVAANAPLRGVMLTASETSTGAAFDVGGIAAAARAVDSEIGIVVDGITGIGTMALETDDWDLDAVVGGSQKAFMIPPGLGFVACSPGGWRRIREDRGQRRYYLDLRRYADSAADSQTPYTPATSLVLQLHSALTALEEAGGIEALERNAQRLSAATRAAAVNLGLDVLATDLPSPAVTALVPSQPEWVPELIAGLRDRHGAIVAGGQGSLKGRIFRIGHIGYTDGIELLGLIASLEVVMRDLGETVVAGTAVATASGVLSGADESSGHPGRP